MAILDKTFQQRDHKSLFAKTKLDCIYIKGNNEASQLASSSNYPETAQRRQTELPQLYFRPFLFFAEGFGFRTKQNTFLRSIWGFVLRRILCGGFRKCFGLVVERSTDKGRQALSLKYNRRTLLRWSATKRGDMLCFVRSLLIYFYLVSIFSIILARGQTHSLPCFYRSYFTIEQWIKKLSKNCVELS